MNLREEAMKELNAALDDFMPVDGGLSPTIKAVIYAARSAYSAGWQARATLPPASGSAVVCGRRLIPDAECVQGKCACTTTGCWDECNMRRNPVLYATQPAAPEMRDDWDGHAPNCIGGKKGPCNCGAAPEMQASHGAVVVSPAPSAALLKTGAKMANVMYNLAQQQGSVLTEEYCAGMSALCKKWDAERRAAPSADSAADTRDAWLPIESAPLDKSVLLWWRPVNQSPAAEACVHGQVSSYTAGAWWDPQAAEYRDLDRVTLWQPLPAPPRTPPARKLANPDDPAPQEHDALADVKIDEKGPK